MIQLKLPKDNLMADLNSEIDMESKEKNTKEKILEEALKLFAQSGYMGTSMNDIASKLGVTKAALYKTHCNQWSSEAIFV